MTLTLSGVGVLSDIGQHGLENAVDRRLGGRHHPQSIYSDRNEIELHVGVLGPIP
jgi:hypothetical protein